MIKLILAYIIAFFLSPIIGGIAGLIFLPLLPVFSKIKIPLILVRLTGNIIIGFISVWFSTIVFSWFSIQPTLLMVIVLGLGFALNDFRRISHSSNAIISNEIAGGFGDLLGVIIGGIYFL